MIDNLLFRTRWAGLAYLAATTALVIIPAHGQAQTIGFSSPSAQTLPPQMATCQQELGATSTLPQYQGSSGSTASDTTAACPPATTTGQ